VFGWRDWLALQGSGAARDPGVDRDRSLSLIVALSGGLGAGGALGGFTGAFGGPRHPEYEPSGTKDAVRNGGILLSVHCDDSDWTARRKENSGTPFCTGP